MLPEDCQRFVQFLRERDPVIVTDFYSNTSAEVEDIPDPWKSRGHYCLWNRAILQTLRREDTGKHFSIGFSAPVIEFSYEVPSAEQWEGQPALMQGRIYASFDNCDKEFEKWYNAVVRWIRKSFIRDPALGFQRDSVGPSAYEWFKKGGLLLPGFRPPATESWLAWVSVQNQYRASLIQD